MGFLETAVKVVVLSAVLAFLLQPEVPISGKSLILGTKGYDMKPVIAPSADGWMLKALSYVITQTPFSNALRRKLLNDNGVALIRELGSQVSLPPLYYPMKRVDPDYKPESAPVVDQKELLATGVPEHANALREEYRAHGGFAPRSIMEYAEAYRAGTHKPSDVMRRALSAMRAWEKEGFVIFSDVHDEEVMKQAYASDERFAAGAPISIFDGVPVAFKDNLFIRGHNSYNGYNPDPAYEEYWLTKNSSVDDIMVSRFRDVGAIVFGLTVMVEGGVSPLGYNSHFQGPFNPFSWNRYSGGSSSGSAVAVATGLVPVAIGFDGGGSVRLPSAMSGIHGLATTFARCPFDKDYGGQMIKSGPMAATSDDALLALSVMAQTDLRHFYSQLYDGGLRGPPPFVAYDFNLQHQDLHGMRVGIYRDWFDDADPQVRARCYEVLAFLESRGVQVVDMDIPHLQVMSLAHGMKLSSEMAQAWEHIFYNAPESLEKNTRVLLGLGLTSTAAEILAGEKLKAWFEQYVDDLHKTLRLDAIVTPMLGVEVPILKDSVRPIGESNTGLVVSVIKFASMANYLGLPGYSVPVGNIHPQVRYEKEPADVSVPVGFQLMGRPWMEHKLLRLGRAIEHGFKPKSRVYARPLYTFDPLA